jgi:hypothetical protein
LEFDFKINDAELKRLINTAPEKLTRFVGIAGQAWERDAVESISEGGRYRAEKTGNLKGSITSRVEGGGGDARAIVSANARGQNNQMYAAWVHDGTGIHGPLKRKILPTGGRKALRIVLESGRVIFRRSSDGMKPKPFFKGTIEGVMKRLPKIFKKTMETK